MLVNSLRIPFYLYYWRTIFLIYFDTFADRIVWFLLSGIVLLAVGSRTHNQPSWHYLSIALLASGIGLGTLGTSEAGLQSLSVVGFLATFVGCVLTGYLTVRPKATGNPNRRSFAAIFLTTLALLLLPAEIGSLSYYVLSAFIPGIEFGKSWELVELQLWYTAFPLIPFLYAAFLFSWIWIPVVLKMFGSKPNPDFDKAVPQKAHRSVGKSWLPVVLLNATLAVFLGYYTYFHDPFSLVGTDIYWRHALPAQSVLSSGTTIAQWFAAAARERHPVVVFGIAIASGISGLTPDWLLRYAYVFLILAFSAAIYLLVKRASKNDSLAMMSALAATVSTSTTVGMYTGIVANWLALILWVLSLTPLAIEGVTGAGRRILLFIALSSGSLAILFLHPWTWVAFIVTLVAYSLALLLTHHKHARDVPVLIGLVILINGIVAGLSLLYLSKVQGWRMDDAFTIISMSTGSRYLGVGSWEILVFFSKIWSSFLNPIMLILAVLGIFAVTRRSTRLGLIVVAWIVVASLTTLVVAPSGYNAQLPNLGETRIWRATFLTPFQIPIASGLLFVHGFLNRKLGQTRSGGIAATIVVTVMFLVIAVGAFRALFPLLTDPHNSPGPSIP